MTREQRTSKWDVEGVASRYRPGGERSALEAIQDFHHIGSSGNGLVSKAIEATFNKAKEATSNGSEGVLAAAEIALALIEAHNDHVQANEINGHGIGHGHDITPPGMKGPSAAARPSRPSYDARDDHGRSTTSR